MKKLHILLGGLACLLLIGAGCSAPNPEPTTELKPEPEEVKEPFTIGWLGPLTGDASSLGQDSLKMAQQAVKEVNEDGGINGQELQLAVEDGKCNPKDAAAGGNNLINVEAVPAIIGGLCSGETTAIAPIAEQAKVIVFSGCSSAPNITEAGDFIFRSYPSDAFQGSFSADYAYNKLEKKKIATLAVLGDWGTGVKLAFEEKYKELGGEVVFSEDYAQESKDFRTQITKIKESGAELVYFPGYTEATLAFLKQAKELGLELPLFGADAWDDALIHESDVAEGIMFSIPLVEASGEEWEAKVAEAGANNTVCTPATYNNVKILAEIMNRVGTNTEAIRDELYKVKDYQGVNGKISLDQNGDLIGATYQVKVVKDKKSELVKTEEEIEGEEETEIEVEEKE